MGPNAGVNLNVEYPGARQMQMPWAVSHSQKPAHGPVVNGLDGPTLNGLMRVQYR